MPSRLEKLVEASYRNVSFFIRKESIDQLGQKRIIHDYYNTGSRYVEAQGQVPGEFTLDIFFTGPNWINDFRSFQKAIEDPSPGRLFMPVFGMIDNVVAFPSSAEAVQTEVGEIKISVKFSVTIERPAPTESLTTEEDVAELGQEGREGVANSIQDNYLSPSTKNNFETMASDLNEFANKAKQITGKIREARRFLSKITQAIRSATRIADILLKPTEPIGFLQDIAVTTGGLQKLNIFTALSEYGNNLDNTINAIKANFTAFVSPVTPLPADSKRLRGGTGLGDNNIGSNGIGDSVIQTDTSLKDWGNNTFERRERNQNRYTVVNAVRVVSLIGMYEAAASATYTTTDDIDNTAALLENQYAQLVEQDQTMRVNPYNVNMITAPGNGPIINDLKGTLELIKGLVDEVLKSKRQNAYKIVEIKVEKNYSASLLGYEIYGEYIRNEAQLQFVSNLLIGLNRSLPAHALKGTVKVVEVG